jgi:hypothetical protein
MMGMDMNATRMVCTALAMSLVTYVGLVGAASAQNNAQGQMGAMSFLGVSAQRGLECDLLRPWQSAALQAQIDDGVRNWSAEQLAELEQATAARAQETQCDDEGMNAWIGGASRGFESEMLSNFIVTYAAMARMEPQPALFAQTSRFADHAGALAAIDAKLAALEAAGGTPEGGAPWPDFIARQTTRVQQTVRAFEDVDAPQYYPRDRVEGFIAASVEVTELWLAEGAISGE